MAQSSSESIWKSWSKWYDYTVIASGLIFIFNLLLLDKLAHVLPTAIGDFFRKLFVVSGMVVFVLAFLISVFSLTLKDFGKVNKAVLLVVLIASSILTFFVVLKLLGFLPSGAIFS